MGKVSPLVPIAAFSAIPFSGDILQRLDFRFPFNGLVRPYSRKMAFGSLLPRLLVDSVLLGRRQGLKQQGLPPGGSPCPHAAGCRSKAGQREVAARSGSPELRPLPSAPCDQRNHSGGRGSSSASAPGQQSTWRGKPLRDCAGPARQSR
jgi:hypothetical protein